MRTLNAGDKVAVYHNCGRSLGTIVMESTDNYVIVVLQNCTYNYRFHRKQCRLLKKKRKDRELQVK